MTNIFVLISFPVYITSLFRVYGYNLKIDNIKINKKAKEQNIIKLNETLLRNSAVLIGNGFVQQAHIYAILHINKKIATSLVDGTLFSRITSKKYINIKMKIVTYFTSIK